ncbi:MAG: hypothetical protein LUD15_06655 [Bacteroides sp.]|nr:hypothetical protein [Bacteroides sp.]
MVFKPIIETVNHYAEQLKTKDKCDLIICLSHIGYNQDQELAQQSRNIDIIIGGHSHTYMMDGPDYLKNLDGEEVLVYQVGGTGAFIGIIEVDMKKEKKKK